MDEVRSPPLQQMAASARRKGLKNAALQEAVAPVACPNQVSTPARSGRRATEALGVDVLRRIEQLIISGALRPGERLNEVALARTLGVSRGPVREAARALERTGLVTVIMNSTRRWTSTRSMPCSLASPPAKPQVR
jgi:hypothetical protein